MEIISSLADFLLHVDVKLGELIALYGTYIYLILFLVIFCETGLVVTPFLPGDSLLFAAGSFAAIGKMELVPLLALLMAAAICGDSVNYWIGRRAGPGIFASEKSRIFRRDYLVNTQKYYEMHGGKTVFIARFMPIFRTFVPFVAGIGRMNYGKFLSYSVSGTVVWVNSFALAGFFFGNIPYVRQRFTLVILAIIAISLLPMAIGAFKAWKAKKSRREQ